MRRPVSFIFCASSASITWERTASRRRPAFSSHLVASTDIRAIMSPLLIEAHQVHQGLERALQESSVSTRGDIIRWWEAKRYHFNGFLLAVGLASWLLVMIAGSAAVKTGEDFEEPLGMVFGHVIYLAVANVCYT